MLTGFSGHDNMSSPLLITNTSTKSNLKKFKKNLLVCCNRWRPTISARRRRPEGEKAREKERWRAGAQQQQKLARITHSPSAVQNALNTYIRTLLAHRKLEPYKKVLLKIVAPAVAVAFDCLASFLTNESAGHSGAVFHWLVNSSSSRQCFCCCCFCYRSDRQTVTLVLLADCA